MISPLFALRRTTAIPALFALLSSGSLAARADYRDEVGFTRLQAELGGAIPTGSGVPVTQTEAPENAAGAYLPDVSSAEFVGKTFTQKSAAAGVSNHATTVASYFYGLTSGMASGITAINLYEANSWIGSGFLRYDTLQAPKTESQAITNHSWVGTIDNGGTGDIEALRRFDYAIARDDFLAVVGLNNGSGSPIPALLGSAYNGISVGLSNGDHSSGQTTADGAGRVKPEIVSPFTVTSFATPTVSAAAALLIQQAQSTATPANATHSVTLKAVLLAGATKSQFPGWNRTTTRPLDAHYGAGQLNVFNSYHVLAAGQQAASGSAAVKTQGWDYTATTASPKRYFFDIVAGNTAPGFSAVLTWNRTVATAPTWQSTTSSLADLSLKLYAASGFTVGALVDSSVSPIDNLEHLYEPNLPSGRYALEVTSNQTGVSYGLAWHSGPTVTVAATTATASEQDATPGTFTVTRAGDTTAPLTVTYLVSGSAASGADFGALPGSVTIPAGANSATIPLTPVPDAMAEGDETVMVTLANDFAWSVGGAGSATVAIHDRPIDGWRFGHFNTQELSEPAISGDLADPDADGVTNLVEYALHLDPKAADVSELPRAGVSADGFLTLSYTRPTEATDVTYLVEVSSDLTTWHTGSGYTTSVETIDHGATQTVVVAAVAPASSLPEQFIRLRITRP